MSVFFNQLQESSYFPLEHKFYSIHFSFTVCCIFPSCTCWVFVAQLISSASRVTQGFFLLEFWNTFGSLQWDAFLEMQLDLFSELQLIQPAQMEIKHELSIYRPTAVHEESLVAEKWDLTSHCKQMRHVAFI